MFTPEMLPDSLAYPTVLKDIAREQGRANAEQRRASLASELHHLMTEEKKFEKVNGYRRLFFRDVVEEAKKVGLYGYSSSSEDDCPSSSRQPGSKFASKVVIIIPSLYLTYIVLLSLVSYLIHVMLCGSLWWQGSRKRDEISDHS
jgi:hypothetical protein